MKINSATDNPASSEDSISDKIFYILLDLNIDGDATVTGTKEARCELVELFESLISQARVDERTKFADKVIDILQNEIHHQQAYVDNGGGEWSEGAISGWESAIVYINNEIKLSKEDK